MLQQLKGLLVTLIVFGIPQLISYFLREDNSVYLNSIALYIMVIQWIVYIPSSGIFGNEPTEKYYDITGSLTYLTTLIISFIRLGKLSLRQSIVYIAASIWCIRLGYFLFQRIRNSNGIDDRFTDIKKSRFSFLCAWTIQGLWIFLTLFSILFISQSEDTYNMNVLNILGAITWLIGFLIEVVADLQKSKFRNNPENKGKWISSGLWSRSRHPNYFGEILLWFGIAFTCIQDLNTHAINTVLFISPLFVAFLIIFVSGIPLLEKKSDQRFGDNDEYKKYKENTPVLIPKIISCNNRRNVISSEPEQGQSNVQPTNVQITTNVGQIETPVSKHITYGTINVPDPEKRNNTVGADHKTNGNNVTQESEKSYNIVEAQEQKNEQNIKV